MTERFFGLTRRSFDQGEIRVMAKMVGQAMTKQQRTERIIARINAGISTPALDVIERTLGLRG